MRFEQNKCEFRKLIAWQSGYGVFSVGYTQSQTVINYIANQEKHHACSTLQDEYRLLPEKNQVAYVERYMGD